MPAAWLSELSMRMPPLLLIYPIWSAAGYGSVLEKSVAKMAADEQNGRSPDSVAKVALALAARKNPPARVPVGLDYKALMMLLRVMPDRGKEFILSRLYLPK